MRKFSDKPIRNRAAVTAIECGPIAARIAVLTVVGHMTLNTKYDNVAPSAGSAG